jgi:hypothetical protein
MATARWGFTATLLPDGRVLTVGGQDGLYIVAPQPELYDPKTGAFSPTGKMATSRVNHTATLLNDGRVLIAGGIGTSGAVASAELYDPQTGKFSATGSMIVARAYQTATLIQDGRVLIAGGYDAKQTGSETYASAELYEPATGKFSATGSMASPRLVHTATLLPDGRVMVAGGRPDVDESPTGSVELYDPVAGRFSSTGSMASPRLGHTATLLPDGRVVIAGGALGLWDPRGPLAPLGSCELYDPAIGTFSPCGSLAAARAFHTATLLSDGRVLIAGGAVDSSETAIASAELIQP